MFPTKSIQWLGCAILACIYAAVAVLGASHTVVNGTPPVAWLSSGIGLAALIGWGIRLWPGVVIGSAAAAWLAGLPVDAVAVLALANGLAAAVGATLFARARWHKALDSFADVGGLFIVMAASSVIAAVIGASDAGGPGQGLVAHATTAFGLWQGHFFSQLLFVPLVLGLATLQPFLRTVPRFLEFAALIGFKTVTEVLIHAAQIPYPVQMGLAASTFPLLVWAAARFNLLTVALITCLTLGTGMVATVAGTGPIGEFDPVSQWITLLIFTTFCTGAGLLLHATIEAMRRMQAELRVSERRLRDIADSTSDFFWETDAQGRLVYTSDRFAAFLGRDVMDIVTATAPSAAGAESWRHEPDWPEVRSHIEGRRPYRNLRVPVVTGIGERRMLQVSGKPAFDEGGAFTGFRGACSDVTDQIAASEALLQAQKMETLGQLTGGIAHDFNNLLAVIVGNVELAVQFGEKELKQRAMLERALGAAERGAALVRRLLAFSRRQTLSPKPVDVARLIIGLSDIFEHTLGERVRIRHQLADGLWAIKVDPTQLETAILNLALNARDAMDDEGEIVIEARNVVVQKDTWRGRDPLPPGDYVAIAVIDKGMGMSPETLAHIFEPFFTTKDTGRGSGLGLSMVFGFAQQSGGSIQADSVEGAGTTMTIYLPRLEAVEDAVDDVPASLATLMARGERVLLVEDDAGLRDVMAQRLERLGYGVEVAENGRQALDVLGRNPKIDLLLTDIGLPGGMSGNVLAQQAGEVLPNLRILFMSGYARIPANPRERFGAELPVLHKPFRIDELAACLRAALER